MAVFTKYLFWGVAIVAAVGVPTVIFGPSVLGYFAGFDFEVFVKNYWLHSLAVVVVIFSLVVQSNSSGAISIFEWVLVLVLIAILLAIAPGW